MYRVRGLTFCKLLLIVTMGGQSSLLAARGFHACANEDGSVSFQQTPCDLGPATGIEPLKLSRVTRQAVIDTVALWDRAMKLKDTEALKRLVSRQFELVTSKGLDEKDDVQRIDYATFVARFLWMVPAMRDYAIKRDQIAVTISENGGGYVCRARETSAFLNKNAESATMMWRFAMNLEAGKLRIKRITIYPST